MPMIETNLLDAVEHMGYRYKSLSFYAERMKDIAAKTHKNIPCDVLDAYRAAVKDYFKYANGVFKVLDKNKLKVEQVPLHNGQLVPDPNNPSQVKTLKVDGPLGPPTFSVAPECKTAIPNVAGSDEVGIAPLILGMYIVGGLLITGIGGYFARESLKEFRMSIQGPDYRPDRQVDSYLKVYEKLIATGVPAKEAEERAADVIKAPPPKPGTGWFGPIALGVLAVGGAALYFNMKGKASV